MNLKISIQLLTIIMIIGFTSCKTKEKAIVNVQELNKEKTIPCTELSETDQDYYRAVGSAVALNLPESKEKAKQEAKQSLSLMIKNKTNAITAQYISEMNSETEDLSQLKQKFDGLAVELIKYSIPKMEVACEITDTLKNGQIRTSIALKVSKEAIRKNMFNQLLSTDEIQLQYDHQKFEDVYHNIMKMD